MFGKKIFLTAISSLIAASFSIPVFAIMSIPDGWYLDGGLGLSKESKKSYPGSSSTKGLSGNVDIGYKFMPFFGAEIGYTQYGGTSIQDQFNTKAAVDNHYSYDLAGKGIIPIAASGFELFGKLGVQRTQSKVTIKNATAASNIGISSSRHSHVGLYLGGGAQYSFMPELAGFVQWARAQNDANTGTMVLYSVGLVFIFG
jgi:hypothetical protein